MTKFERLMREKIEASNNSDVLTTIARRLKISKINMFDILYKSNIISAYMDSMYNTESERADVMIDSKFNRNLEENIDDIKSQIKSLNNHYGHLFGDSINGFVYIHYNSHTDIKEQLSDIYIAFKKYICTQILECDTNNHELELDLFKLYDKVMNICSKELKKVSHEETCEELYTLAKEMSTKDFISDINYLESSILKYTDSESGYIILEDARIYKFIHDEFFDNILRVLDTPNLEDCDDIFDLLDVCIEISVEEIVDIFNAIRNKGLEIFRKVKGGRLV